MAEVKVINKIVYYSIKEDLTYKEHQNFEAAKEVLNLKYILKQVIGSIPFELTSGSFIQNYASTMHLLDLNGIEIEDIEQNGWRFKINGCGVSVGYAFNVMYIAYTDTFGNVKEENFSISVDGFIKAYKQFERLDKYQGYKLAKVSIENEDLRLETQSQKELIATLSAENRKLKEQLSELA